MSTPLSSCFSSTLLKSQVAFITGGATGIGFEICRVFGQHGARIAIMSRKEENLRAAQQTLRAEGIDVHYVVGDVREPDVVTACVQDIMATYGRIDILVNNAAGNFPAPMTKISPNGFRSVVAIDLLGTYNVSRAVFDAWQAAHGGNIINISAPFELKGVAMQAHVGAAKAGVDSLTRTCAVEWGPYGIRVNGIAPGTIAGTEGVRRFKETVPGAENADTPEGSGAPLGIVGHGSDIAYAALYFCSPVARFVTGQIIEVDGGASVDLFKMKFGPAKNA